MQEEQKPLIITADVPSLLLSAPLDSELFRFARGELDSYMSSRVKIDAKRGEIKKCLLALAERFADGHNLNGLAQKIGHCLVVGAFYPALSEDEGRTRDGAMGRVNEFAEYHAQDCPSCSQLLYQRPTESESDMLEAVHDMLANLVGRMVHV